ncbi:AAA family ATPase [Hoylesella nanceiensis]|uniref:AAA family ATPase n=1 Tax=Hoylesella nanceiensis TaxID=425941 RepID=UPI001CAF9B7A|nr:AAA family ATPase [Hoylesella nanceiensis]MBF1421818.1 AAA family ATPase [Hoylesella nanceiensis]
MTKQIRAYNPREVSQKKYEVIKWNGQWRESFGRPAMNETWFISGASAQGKSSFVMQLAKKLCEYGKTLYVSAEEGIRQSFQRRLEMFEMNSVGRKLSIIEDPDINLLKERLSKPKSPRFIIIDSFQMANWTYQDAMELIETFNKKSFIFISQEYKSRPMGADAVRLRYAAGVKIRVSGFMALCSGREKETAGGGGFVVWDEGAIRYGNKIAVEKKNEIDNEINNNDE